LALVSLAKTPSGRKMKLTPEFSGSFQGGFRNE